MLFKGRLFAGVLFSGALWGSVQTVEPPVIEPEPYSTGDDSSHDIFIQQQNRTLISLLIGFAAQGAFE